MTRFAEIVHNLKRDGRTEVPDSWKQGRTAFGGLTAGLCVEAAGRIEGLPPLRSLQMTFTGPVMGEPEFTATRLRQGRNVSAVRVDVREGDKAVGDALLLFGQARDSALSDDDPCPAVMAPEDAEPFMPPGGAAFVPNFFANFEVALVDGARPMSGADEGHVLAWARHADASSREGVSAFVCLGDVLPPAAFAMMRAPAPISSINWMLNLMREPQTREGWYLIESRQTAARDGYSSQRMRFWSTDGHLVAEGLQMVAVFG